MIDERAKRRASFEPGAPIRLANRQFWSLPAFTCQDPDPRLRDALQALREAEDLAETTRGELALMILLLSRNYDLTPEDFEEILSYPAGDPALEEMQGAVHGFVCQAMRSASTRASELPSRPRRPRRWWPLDPQPVAPRTNSTATVRSRR